MTPPRPVVSAAAEKRYARLAAYQAGDAEAGWLLLLACEAHARVRGLATRALRHDATGSGARRLHSPSRCPPEYLQRLRFMAGVFDHGQTETQLRAEIAARPRLSRCTRTALRSAALATLTPGTGPGSVRILEQWLGNPFRVMVVVPTQACPFPAATLAACRRHEPLYALIDLELSDGPLIDEGTRLIDDTPATIDDATVADVT